MDWVCRQDEQFQRERIMQVFNGAQKKPPSRVTIPAEEKLPQAFGHDVSHQSAYKPEQAVALSEPKVMTPKHEVEVSMGYGLSL